MDLNETLELHGKRLLGDLEGRLADLSGAFLSGADLSGANLSGATLPSTHVLLLTTQAGYPVFGVYQGGVWRIIAGCRDFSLDEAKAHWSAPDYHTPLDGRRIVAVLRWFEEEVALGNIEEV